MDSKSVLNPKYSKVCRCCHKEDGLHDISESIDSDITYEAMLKYTFNIKLTELHDTSAKHICEGCINSLQSAHMFKRNIHSSEQTILEYMLRLEFEKDVNVLGTEIKIEPLDLYESTDVATDMDDENDDSFNDNDEILANVKQELEQETEDAAILNSRKRKRSLRSTTKSKKCKSNTQSNKIMSKSRPQKDWSKIIERRGQGPLLRENSLKLIEKSTLCIFQWNKSWYQCFCCKEAFPNIDELKQHTSNFHTQKDIERKMIMQNNRHVKVEISSLHCNLCREKLDNITTLTEHLSRTHSMEIGEHLLVPFKLGGNWDCQLCPESFEGFRLLNMHMNKHYPKQICHICGLSFPHLMSLNLHKSRSHRTYDCKSCKINFESKLGKKQHDISVHDVKFETKLRFPCPRCSERFSQEYSRIYHMVEKHGAQKPDLRCDICSKTFVTRSLVNNHVRNVHKKEKNKECDVCHNFFYTKSDLQRHMVTHTREKKFSCEICNGSFATKDSVRRHAKRFHLS